MPKSPSAPEMPACSEPLTPHLDLCESSAHLSTRPSGRLLPARNEPLNRTPPDAWPLSSLATSPNNQ